LTVFSRQPEVVTPSGPFRLDPNVIADIEKDWVKSDVLFEFLDRYKPIDISFMDTPIKVIPVNGVSYPEERFQKLLSNNSLQAHSGSGGGDSYSSYTVSPPQARPPTMVAKQKPPSKYVLINYQIYVFFKKFCDWIFRFLFVFVHF
jgi:cytoskeleton-associated protein 5